MPTLIIHKYKFLKNKIIHFIFAIAYKNKTTKNRKRSGQPFKKCKIIYR